MEYELFKQLVTGRIKEYMPPVFDGYQVDVRRVTKVNETKDAFYIRPPVPNPKVAIPTLYLDDLYEDFSADEDLERILQTAASVFIRWSGIEAPEIAGFCMKEHTDCIAANLINTQMNQALLEKVPHTEFLDMSVIYRLVHSANERGVNSAIITTEMMRDAELSVQELHQLAMENTARLFPVHIITGNEEDVCVMTNELGICGATTMLYEEDMQKLAQAFDGDFYIMPTSIHEFFAVRTGVADANHLAQMLEEGNRTITRPEEQLSSKIYLYRAAEGKIQMVREE